LLELFKKNTFFSLLLLIPYAIILHAGAWFTQIPSTNSPNCWVYNKIVTGLELSYRIEIVLSVLLIIMQAVLIGRITSKYKLNSEGQLYGSLFFILFFGFHYSTLGLNAALIANLFLTFGVGELFGVYLRKNANIQLFNFGFLIGVASIFYVPYYVFLLLGLIGIVILRGTRFKELFQLLGGFINVYLLTYALLYAFNLQSEFWDQQIIGFFSPYIFPMKIVNMGWVALGLFTIFILIGLMNYQFFQSKRTIIVQKQYDLIYWMIFVSLWSIFFLKIDHIHHLIILFTPLSFLMGSLLTRLKNPLLMETLHLFLISTSLFLQFQNW
jgi:hypothetical protein